MRICRNLLKETSHLATQTVCHSSREVCPASVVNDPVLDVAKANALPNSHDVVVAQGKPLCRSLMLDIWQALAPLEWRLHIGSEDPWRALGKHDVVVAGVQTCAGLCLKQMLDLLHAHGSPCASLR